MNEYTVEYKLIYTMTKVVKAEDEDEAINAVMSDPMEGDEHDAYADDFTVIECEEHQMTDKEKYDERCDIAYERMRDDRLTDGEER